MSKIKTGHKVTTVKGLVDSGNSLHYDMAIRRDLHTSLGVGFKSQQRLKVGTAKQGSGLQALGVSNPIKLQIQNVGEIVVSPVVLESLSDPINYGNMFLHKLSKRKPVGNMYPE